MQGTGLSCKRWKNIKRSSARSVSSLGPQCGGSQACAKLAQSPADRELCALAALSMSFSLRAVEALSVSYDGGTVHYTGAKGQRGRHSEEAGPWAREWGEFLQMLRARHGFPPARSAWFRSRGAPQAQCARSATIWASGRARDPYFEILGAPRGITVTPSGGFDF